MVVREGGGDPCQQRVEQRLRQRAVGLAGAFGIERAGQQPDADQEHFLGGEVAGAVERVFDAFRRRQEGVDSRRHPRFVEAFADRRDAARVDRRVEHVRPLRDDLGEPRRAAEEVAEQFAHRRVGAQDRQQLDRAEHVRQRRVEGGERRVGVAGAGEGDEQRRRQFGQHLARAGALHRRAAAEMPAADRLGGGLRPLEAEPAQGRQRLRVVDDAGEDEAARLDVELRRVLEQPRVMALDPLEMAGQLAARSVSSRA